MADKPRIPAHLAAHMRGVLVGDRDVAALALSLLERAAHGREVARSRASDAATRCSSVFTSRVA